MLCRCHSSISQHSILWCVCLRLHGWRLVRFRRRTQGRPAARAGRVGVSCQGTAAELLGEWRVASLSPSNEAHRVWLRRVAWHRVVARQQALCCAVAVLEGQAFAVLLVTPPPFVLLLALLVLLLLGLLVHTGALLGLRSSIPTYHPPSAPCERTAHPSSKQRGGPARIGCVVIEGSTGSGCGTCSTDTAVRSSHSQSRTHNHGNNTWRRAHV